MKASWQIEGQSKNLLLVCLGFAMDPQVVKNISAKSHDVLLLYDYSDFEISESLLDKIKTYDRINSIAWSLGVWVAETCLYGLTLPWDQKIAINGTLWPIDKEFGIAPEIFELTLKNFNEEGRNSFFKNVCGSDEIFSQLSLPSRDLANQVYELQYLKEKILGAEPLSSSFTKAIIAKRDRIIPSRSQEKFWKDLTEVQFIEGGHFPFHHWQFWENILE